MPPPMRNAFFPFAFSRGKPFPRGPMMKRLSPAFIRENCSVPVFSPVTRYTTRSAPPSLSISQMLMGRGSSFVPSFVYMDMNCPGFAVFAVSVHIHMLKIPSASCSWEMICTCSFFFVIFSFSFTGFPVLRQYRRSYLPPLPWKRLQRPLLRRKHISPACRLR